MDDRRVAHFHRPQRPLNVGQVLGVVDLFVPEELGPGPVRGVRKAMHELPGRFHRPPAGEAVSRRKGNRGSACRNAITWLGKSRGPPPASAPARDRARPASRRRSAGPPGSCHRARSASGRTSAGPQYRCRRRRGRPRAGQESGVGRRPRPASLSTSTSSGGRWTGKSPGGAPADSQKRDRAGHSLVGAGEPASASWTARSQTAAWAGSGPAGRGTKRAIPAPARHASKARIASPSSRTISGGQSPIASARLSADAASGATCGCRTDSLWIQYGVDLHYPNCSQRRSGIRRSGSPHRHRESVHCHAHG